MHCHMSDETAETYKWIFTVICEELEKLGKKFQPRDIIADSSTAISKAVATLENRPLRTNCWFHTSKGVKDIIGKKQGELGERLYSDIAFLQLLCWPELFEQGQKLFIRKWTQFGEMVAIVQR